jgi:hypothetical protein
MLFGDLDGSGYNVASYENIEEEQNIGSKKIIIGARKKTQ